jgi:hypothetical protein
MDSNYQGLPASNMTNNRGGLRNRSVSKSGSSSSSSGGKKSSHSSLPAETVDYLKAWMMSPEHISHPYPTDAEKATIMAETGIEIKQLTNWFVNNRKRFWKPRVEAAQKHGIASHRILGSETPASVSSSRIERVEQTSPSLLTLRESNHQVTLVMSSSNYTDLNKSSVAPVSVSDSSYTNYSSDEGSVENGEECRTETERVFSTPPSTVSTHSLSHESATRFGSFHDEQCAELITRREVVDVHILQPYDSGLPAIKDVTILSKVQQSDRILKSFMGCKISYSFSKKVIGNRKKVQSRRDAEVVRIKKFYLRKYLASLGDSKNTPICPAPTNIMIPTLPKIPSPSHYSLAPTTNFLVRHLNEEKENDILFVDAVVSNKRKKLENGMKQYREWRKESSDEHHEYADLSVNAWKNACKKAKHGYCDSLPSLEEAAQMFGYVQQ